MFGFISAREARAARESCLLLKLGPSCCEPRVLTNEPRCCQAAMYSKKQEKCDIIDRELPPTLCTCRKCYPPTPPPPPPPKNAQKCPGYLNFCRSVWVCVKHSNELTEKIYFQVLKRKENTISEGCLLSRIKKNNKPAGAEILLHARLPFFFFFALHYSLLICLQCIC